MWTCLINPLSCNILDDESVDRDQSIVADPDGLDPEEMQIQALRKISLAVILFFIYLPNSQQGHRHSTSWIGTGRTIGS